MIKTGIFKLRDPFVLEAENCYYIYGTDTSSGGWEDTRWGCYRSVGKTLTGRWEKLKEVYIRPKDAEKNFWAPEVHKYKGSYYMLASYYSRETRHRGCAVLRSDSPEGPFTEISNGHFTPREWDAIDATLYIDGEGTPWTVFVHEWTCTEDGIGRMVAARLSEDLTRLCSEPKELFRADDAPWANYQVTDGPFLYNSPSTGLLMLWSNSHNGEYRVGLARSRDGRVDGEWEQLPLSLYEKATGGLDGGHGMLFRTGEGLYMAIHSPNDLSGGLSEEAVIIPVSEREGRIFCEVE